MDAPERIWAGDFGWFDTEQCAEVATEYVRADLYARLAAENEKLLAYARETNCPRPCNGRPDDFAAVQCVEAGECGCGALAALSGGKDGE